MDDAEQAGRRFAELIRILDTLRGEGGCPWDREQDERSIADFFLEEVYEAVDAIYEGDPPALREELGDVLMEIVFLARLFKEKGDFRISEVVGGINRKMIQRHPHVFGRETVAGSAGVKRAWNARKLTEKGRESLFDGMPERVPALLRALLIGKKAATQGFDWGNIAPVLEKVHEELAELKNAREAGGPAERTEEVGDLLFSLVNLSRHLGVNPEIALHRACAKFITRYRHIEAGLRDQGRAAEGATLEEMEALWEQAKLKE